MNHAAPLVLASASLVLCAAAPAQKLKGRIWTHEKFGIKLTIPDGYETVPLKIDEKWIAAKFLSDKTYLSKSREWNHEHRPLMRVIIFTEKAKKESAAEVHEEEDGSTFIGIGAVPYQGYRDYVKRHRSGFFFSEEKEAKIAGEDCLLCEVDIHKSEPKLHLYSVVFRRPTFEIAVEFEVLEDRTDVLEKTCMRSLKSIRFSEPSADAMATGAAITGGKSKSTRVWTAFRSEWRKRSIEERTDIRRTMERRHHQAVREKTPEDWSITESEHFLVVSHAGPKFTKQMTDGAEMFYDWCEKRFGDLGDDYIRRPVLRLCKDYDEYKAFHFDSSKSTGWTLFGANHEIGTYYDNYNGSSGRDISVLFGQILIHFLQEKDSLIVTYTPFWLTWAVDSYISSAYVKGRKIDFQVDDYVRDESRAMHRDGKLPTLKKLLTMGEDEFRAMMEADRRAGYAATQALRFVMASREKAFKDFLPRYFRAAISVAEKHESDWKEASYKEATTEEEEEEQAKEYSKRSRERAKKVQGEINDLVFGQITPKTWKKLEKKFAAFVRKGK